MTRPFPNLVDDLFYTFFFLYEIKKSLETGKDREDLNDCKIFGNSISLEKVATRAKACGWERLFNILHFFSALL